MHASSKYQSIFETVLDGIIVINESGIIEDLNPSACQLFGYTPDELIGKNVSVLMQSPDREQHDEYINRYQETRQAKIIGIGREVEGLKKDGTTFPFRLAVSEYHSFGNVFYTGIIHDLTNQKAHENFIREYSEKLELEVEQRTEQLKNENELKKQAEAALMESQKLYEVIAENFPNGTISVLDRDFTIVFIEGSELKSMGYSTQNLMGKSYMELLPEDVRETVKDNLAQVMQGEKLTFQFNQNGRAYRARCVPLFNSEGVVDQVLMVENNITRERQAEEEIYRSLQKEKELNELKSRFVSMASHEFRTPLSSVLSSAGLISRYELTEQHEKRLKHVKKIKSNVRYLTDILNDFLSLQKIEEGVVKNKPELVCLEPLFQEVKEDAEAVSKNNQKIKINGLDSSDHFSIDPFLFKNVLMNLFSNAIKYSQDDVDVQVELENGLLKVDVCDYGIGISKEDQEQLFERFYRASNAGSVEGTGLGLNIVQKHLNMMGGSIELESELNKGSTFKLRLNDNAESTNRADHRRQQGHPG
jgi:PAS domain S-box-containing protein